MCNAKKKIKQDDGMGPDGPLLLAGVLERARGKETSMLVIAWTCWCRPGHGFSSRPQEDTTAKGNNVLLAGWKEDGQRRHPALGIHEGQ